jgi:hypothetical protein
MESLRENEFVYIKDHNSPYFDMMGHITQGRSGFWYVDIGADSDIAFRSRQIHRLDQETIQETLLFMNFIRYCRQNTLIAAASEG